MGNILIFDNVSLNFGIKPVLRGVSFGMDEHDKVGVIGINGTGKSTFLKLASGELEPDEGRIVLSNGLKVSSLPQNPVFDDDLTILENVAARVSGKESHWDTEGEVRVMLQRFGIADPSLHPAQLSGGQKKRAALVAAVLTPSDLLILDEPTNHLDEDMILWLQDFLQNYRGALLMVTHDRYFLDEVTGEILEIDKGSAYRYDAGYSGYLELRQQRFDYALAAERKMAALYKKDLAWMQRGARARSTKQKAHIQRFEALRDRDKIVQDRQVEINSLPSRIGGKTIEAHAVSGGYGGCVLFHDFTYMFTKTDRVGIIGPNGCGKTTLLKTLLGIIPPASGSVEIGQTIRIGYFSQENETLDEDKRVIDYIRDTAEYIRTADGLVSASAMCERFLFSPEMQYARISKLSGGEKRRLYLLRVLMEAPNVLVLDEPTNDLDITTLQVLEDYLDRFAGIIITVSHDRYFLDRVVTRLFAFEKDGTLFKSEGGYSEYREHREALRGREDSLWSSAPSGPSGSREASGASGKGSLQGDASGKGSSRADAQGRKNPQVGAGNATARRGKLSYKDQREYDTIEEEIDRLQAQSDDLAAQIQENATDFEKLAELSAKKDETDAEIDRKMERYLELQDMVDALRGDVR